MERPDRRTRTPGGSARLGVVYNPGGLLPRPRGGGADPLGGGAPRGGAGGGGPPLGAPRPDGGAPLGAPGGGAGGGARLLDGAPDGGAGGGGRARLAAIWLSPGGKPGGALGLGTVVGMTASTVPPAG